MKFLHNHWFIWLILCFKLLVGFLGIAQYPESMAGSQSTPQVGLQPQTIRDHAIQLEADVRALKEYRINPTGNKLTPKWNMIEPMLESIIGYLKKTRTSQPPTSWLPEYTRLQRPRKLLAKTSQRSRTSLQLQSVKQPPHPTRKL